MPSEPLVAEHALEFPGGYTRTTGPVIGRFLTELRDGRLVGVRTADGRVLVPPLEYDPHTGEPTDRLVAATVLGPNLAVADAYATALYAAGPAGLAWFRHDTDYRPLFAHHRR